jgi:nitroreductase
MTALKDDLAAPLFFAPAGRGVPGAVAVLLAVAPLFWAVARRERWGLLLVAFAETLPVLFPHAPGAKDWFADPAAARETAFRNSSLQGGYFLLAARALGLDVGPMSGFDAAGVKAGFFAGTAVEPNFIVNLGYGSDENLFPRSPRLGFEEAVQIL